MHFFWGQFQAKCPGWLQLKQFPFDGPFCVALFLNCLLPCPRFPWVWLKFIGTATLLKDLGAFDELNAVFRFVLSGE